MLRRGRIALWKVRDLRGAPHGQLAAAILGEHAAGLDRSAGDAMVDDAPLDDHIGLGKAGVEVATAERPFAHLVRAQVLVYERDLMGKTLKQLQSLHFRRDRDWLQS